MRTRRCIVAKDGFKAHVAVEPDTGIIADCGLTKAHGADTHDAVVGVELLEGQLEGEAGPFEVLGDSAYGTGQARADLAAAGQTAIIKPWPLRPAVVGGFTIDDFIFDEEAGTLTCPNGVVRTLSMNRNAKFGVACRECPLRARCTASRDGRAVKVHEHETPLRATRRQAETPELQTVYREKRPMVERSISWLTRGNRKLRYRGIAKNDHWLHHRVAALNLRRLLNLGLSCDHNGWAMA